MTSKIASMVATRLFKEDVKNKFGQEDPYFETVPATRLSGRPSNKMKKRKKAAPPGLSKNDIAVLTQMKRRAYRLDMSLFNCCGIRFGWSSVIGIIPFLGDFADMMFAMMVVRTCRKIDGGLPESLRVKMVMNVVIDFVVGLIPIIGDLADAVYKCNTRNAVLLEHYLRTRGEENMKRDGLTIPEDPSLPHHYDNQLTVPSSEELPRHNQDVSPGSHSPAPVARLTADQKSPAATTSKTPKKSRWSFMGSSSDGVERGVTDPKVQALQAGSQAKPAPSGSQSKPAPSGH